MFFVHGKEVSRAQYSMKNFGKDKILWLDTCLLYLYLPPDWVGQYLVTYHNNVTHIYSTVAHDV